MMERLRTPYLILAAAVVMLIGLGMVAMPVAFYGGYGIDAAASVDLANELRSPGLWLVVTGAAIGAGIWSPEMRHTSLGIAAAFYLSFAAARGVSLATDGIPGTGLMAAMASEILLGAAGALLWWRRA